MNIMYDEYSWPEMKELLPKVRGVIVPLGSVEEHGYHLPLCVDNALGFEMSKRLAEKTGCLLLPIFPFGQVWSTRNFPGAISLSEETIVSVLVEVALSLKRHGVKNVIFHSGHLGNAPAMKKAARVLYDNYDFKNVFYFAYPDYVKLSQGVMEAPMWKGNGMHAAEFETSMMLAVRPELVHLERAVIEYPEDTCTMDFRCMPWEEYTATGAPGDPTISTKEKGEELIRRLVGRMTELIDQFIK
ncbi:MAG: creatininase family protein [Erysipelotrichaceae bacterium]|nr:creatininase family protein [Erysipelotrichaceae bacterium]